MAKARHTELVLRRVRVEGFKSLRDVTLELGGPSPLVLVGANGSGKTNVVELFLFLRRALHDDLARRPYAPHAEWGSPRNLTWEASGNPIRVRLEYDLVAGRGGERSRERLLYTVVFAPDPALATLIPVYEKIELPGLSYVLERHENMLKAQLRADEAGDELCLQLQKHTGASVEPSEGWCRVAQRLEGRGDVPPLLVAPTTLPVRVKSKGFLVDLVMLPNCCAALIPFPPNRSGLRASTVLRLLRSWFGGIVVLRQVDYGSAKWPHNRYSDRTLRPRAENLAEILYHIMRDPKARERVEAAMATLFPWLEVRVEFNEYGQIMLVFYERRGEKSIQLYPAMVPDGAVKLLSIIAAIALRPSLLAVDEIENSMHAALIDYIMRELEDLGKPAILTTHSPLVVDLAGPERTLLLRRSPDGSTIAERLASKELWEKMKEEGLTLSDYYLYAVT